MAGILREERVRATVDRPRITVARRTEPVTSTIPATPTTPADALLQAQRVQGNRFVQRMVHTRVAANQLHRQPSGGRPAPKPIAGLTLSTRSPRFTQTPFGPVDEEAMKAWEEARQKQAIAAAHEAAYQAEQARICAKRPDWCESPGIAGAITAGLFAPFTTAIGVPSYYLKTYVPLTDMQNARSGVEYFEARDRYITARVDIAETRINEEAGRYASAAIEIQGGLLHLGGSTAGGVGGVGARSTGSRYAMGGAPRHGLIDTVHGVNVRRSMSEIELAETEAPLGQVRPGLEGFLEEGIYAVDKSSETLGANRILEAEKVLGKKGNLWFSPSRSLAHQFADDFEGLVRAVKKVVDLF